MAIVGFKQYSDRDKYAARRGANKMINMIWKIVVVAAIVIALYYTVKFLAPWNEQVTTAINGPPVHENMRIR